MEKNEVFCTDCDFFVIRKNIFDLYTLEEVCVHQDNITFEKTAVRKQRFVGDCYKLNENNECKNFKKGK